MKTRKLTPSQVIEIRHSCEPHGVVADRYGVSFMTVSNVRRRLVYKWVMCPGCDNSACRRHGCQGGKNGR